MSIWNMIETLLIGPLKLLFEFIFQISSRFIDHPGICIIFLSLTMNILVLPLYRRADAMQEQSRDVEARLHDGVAHIKKAFSGDEKMMILQTYYRQNHYKPTDALKGSVSLLLEIPFFMAAYQFLSHLEILKGVSFGPITDLGQPDGLLIIGGIAINLLPILMTLINAISSALYLRGFPLKTKIQLYGMALFFLVFLYQSPAGLVFYWTLNNIFSLVKTIFYKLKHPKTVIAVLTFAIGFCTTVFASIFYISPTLKQKLFLIGIGAILMIIPIVATLISRIAKNKTAKEAHPNKKIFILGCLFLTVLVGVLIPSALIASSPLEFVSPSYFHHPTWYVVDSLLMAAGTFLIWLRVFYWLASPAGKVVFDRLIWVICGIFLVNYMFFGTNLGVITSYLQFESGLFFTLKQQAINIGVIIAVSAVMYLLVFKFKKAASSVLLISVIAFGAMSCINIAKINSSVTALDTSYSSNNPHFSLSKKGKNVVVIMLDRAMGSYVPYLFNEKPELKEKFDGFTYYSNVISYGLSTNQGTPAMLGGYEYTPVEINKRANESLASKQNEALKVLPVLFANNGYKSTVCDPVYANYSWVPDLSIFDDCPDVNAYITKGKFTDSDTQKAAIEENHRNFFCFSLMKTMPLSLQTTLYANGTYNHAGSLYDEASSSQIYEDAHKAEGIRKSFIDSYNALKNMSKMTQISDDDTNTYLFFSSDMTHDIMLLTEPDYLPSETVDNTAYDAEHTNRFTVNGVTLKMETQDHYSHYQSNMAAMLLLADWFDYLRENGVYDNTKIIIVADHGRDLRQLDEMMADTKQGEVIDMEMFYPLMMVKDFGATGFTTSDEYMTNADVPTIATKDLIDSPVNPFTGKLITDSEKYAHDQIIIWSHDWDTSKNNGNQFLPSKWISAKRNIFDKDNWTFSYKVTILDENKLP